MFNEYYIVNHRGEIIYFSIITMNETHETSLYSGASLLKRASIEHGVHLLTSEDVKLRIELKWFSIKPELRIDDTVVEHRKLKRKELREILKANQITNEINPKEKPKEPFKLSEYKTQIIFILIGTLLSFLSLAYETPENKLLLIVPMIILASAYYSLFAGFINKVPDYRLDEKGKSTLKLLGGLGGMIITMMFLEEFVIP